MGKMDRPRRQLFDGVFQLHLFMEVSGVLFAYGMGYIKKELPCNISSLFFPLLFIQL